MLTFCAKCCLSDGDDDGRDDGDGTTASTAIDRTNDQTILYGRVCSIFKYKTIFRTSRVKSMQQVHIFLDCKHCCDDAPYGVCSLSN